MQNQIREINNIIDLTVDGRLPWESIGHEFKAQKGDSNLVLYVYPGDAHAEKLTSLFADGNIGSFPSYLTEVSLAQPERSIIAETPESPLYKLLLKLQDVVVDSIRQRFATPLFPLEHPETITYLISLQDSGEIELDNAAMTAISALRNIAIDEPINLSLLSINQRLKLQETLCCYTIESCPRCGHRISLSEMLQTIQTGLCHQCNSRLQALARE